MRLATRIALWSALLLPVLVLGAGALLLGLVTHDLRAEQDTKLQERAQAVLPNARALLTADRQGRSQAAQNQHRLLLEAALDVGVLVVDAGGQPVSSGGPMPTALPAADTAGKPATVRSDGRSWRVLARPLAGANSGTLWVAAPASAADGQVNAVRGRIILVAVLAAPLSGLLAFGLARRATAPLSRLGRQAAALDPAAGAAGFAHRRSGIGEVDELAAALESALARYDQQAARTAQALETARSFSAAASHELRTPLMGLQTNLDVLAGHPDLPAEERAEILADLHDDHRRLLDLLTALRTLARGDLVEDEAFGPVELAEPLSAAVAELRRRHPAAVVTAAPSVTEDGGAGAGAGDGGFTGSGGSAGGGSASSELASGSGSAGDGGFAGGGSASGGLAGGSGFGDGGELRVFGWEAGLRIVCDNLLVNAAVHGHRPGEPARVTVGLRRVGAQVVLTVDDDGPGVPVAERAAVFDRFHRRAGSPGSGLGLTLVAQQVALHRGTVTVDTPPGGRGCRFEVRLPLVRPDAPTPPLPARREWISASGPAIP
ncbi:two-component system sensor histidine kinase PrrB [Kitasatospora sp. GP30]|uniref:sensor histidine kinase n=1 Tax=Kitasatospora sp. GP30 TaxID=3035084 RepID=UPI000CB65403|nr:HAMP domain-containing sensor histidine kinase [Kitasatospora sp. GP30]MDH6145824.1 two-component system sensor histidine kinase PrrB [Kitasatospora sp. GP30]